MKPIRPKSEKRSRTNTRGSNVIPPDPQNKTENIMPYLVKFSVRKRGKLRLIIYENNPIDGQLSLNLVRLKKKFYVGRNKFSDGRLLDRLTEDKEKMKELEEKLEKEKQEIRRKADEE